MPTMLDVALAYVEKGYSVFPLRPGEKQPLTKNGYWDASQDVKVIRTWWQKFPNANIGLPCAPNNLIVLDIDRHPGKKDGFENYHSLAGYEPEPAATPQADTARGGRHFIFAAPPGTLLVKREIVESVEVKYNGYIVAAPSTVDGKKYAWLKRLSLLECTPPPMPAWLLDHAIRVAPVNESNIEISTIDHASVREALRFIPKDIVDEYHSWLNVGMALKHAGLAMEVWDDWSKGSSKYKPGECADKWDSFQGTGITARTIYHYAKIGGFKRLFKFDDIGNSERFCTDHGDTLRWFPAIEKWLCWDGRRWKPDEVGFALNCAKATARKIHQEAAECEDEDRRKKISGWANLSSSASRLEAMLKLAKPDLAITIEDLDRDQFKINCLNGTVDLHTGELKPHNRGDYITKLAPVAYRENAPAHRFNRFLSETFQDSAGLIEFVQRAFGYALTGSVSEQKLFVLYGGGQNGKSTLINAIRDVMGEYAQETDPCLLIARRQAGGANEDVARLRGIRLATTVETNEDVFLDEARVKQLTGGDRITARYLYGHFCEFEPTHKLFLITNHKPRIKSQAMAMWRRIKMIPFDACVSESKKDKDLPDKLREEREGIFLWLVSGCLQWAKEGLPEPSEVENATRSYKVDEDRLARFIDERCIIAQTAQSEVSSIRRSYNEWCIEAGEIPLSRTVFNHRMEEKNFVPKRNNSGRFWTGLKLRDDDFLNVAPINKHNREVFSQCLAED